MPGTGAYQNRRDLNTVMTVHMLVFASIYTVYGQNICPILNGLPVHFVILPALAALGMQLVLRSLFKKYIAGSRIDRRIRWSFWVDFGLFCLGGLILALANRYFFNLPVENLLKTSVSFVALGFYIALDMSLIRERREMNALAHSGASFPQAVKAMPFTRKFVLFSVINLVVLAGTTTLVG